MNRTVGMELAAYLSAAVAACVLLAVSREDLSLLVGFGGVCWIGGVLWQRLADHLDEVDAEDDR